MRVGQPKRLALLGLMALAVAAFFALDLDQTLTLASLKARQAQLAAYTDNHLGLAASAYFLLYVLVASLSLPGALVLSLAGGAVFGLGLGTLLVSFASTIGATLACIVSRYLLRDWVAGRFPGAIGRVNQGVARQGGLYLLSLRLIPAFPFFLVNLAMGLTTMRLATYYLVSQLGMLPTSVVVVNAGARLAEIESATDVFSPGLLLSLAAIGLLPLAAKPLVTRLRR